MALLTDSDIIVTADLMAIDSEVSAVAAATKSAITIEGDASICRQAWQECAQQITSAIQMYTSYLTQPGMSGGHVAAVQNVGTPARTQPRARLQQIVATESQYGSMQSAVQTWIAYTALAILFRDASSRLGKDRYEEKYERYKDEATRCWNRLRTSGLPFVWQPLEAPGAKHGYAPGTWGVANITTPTLGGAVGGSFRVAVTYYDSSRYVSATDNGNAESAGSEAIAVTAASGKGLAVSIASLNPPTGAPDQVGTSQGAWTPLAATHWQVWVGAATGPLYLQAAGIPIATKTWTATADPTLSGTALGSGQWQDLNMTFQNVAARG